MDLPEGIKPVLARLRETGDEEYGALAGWVEDVIDTVPKAPDDEHGQEWTRFDAILRNTDRAFETFRERSPTTAG